MTLIEYALALSINQFWGATVTQRRTCLLFYMIHHYGETIDISEIVDTMISDAVLCIHLELRKPSDTMHSLVNTYTHRGFIIIHTDYARLTNDGYIHWYNMCHMTFPAGWNHATV